MARETDAAADGDERRAEADESRADADVCDPVDVAVVGGGVAGLTAAVFTARADLETVVVDAGEWILRRNAHLENFAGFPGGVDARLLLDLLGEQAERAGCRHRANRVERVERVGTTFRVETADGETLRAETVIAATKNAVGYLEPIDGVGIVDRGKRFVDVEDGGRTGVDGLYAAGRLAEKPHQAIVAAGHGAEVAVALLEDHERPFYHDWVAPEGYFTDRGRDLPPGCAEIGDAERRRREAAGRSLLRDRLAEPHPEGPETHPSLREE